jgi:hypothetical protein
MVRIQFNHQVTTRTTFPLRGCATFILTYSSHTPQKHQCYLFSNDSVISFTSPTQTKQTTLGMNQPVQPTDPYELQASRMNKSLPRSRGAHRTCRSSSNRKIIFPITNHALVIIRANSRHHRFFLTTHTPCITN